MAFHIEKMHLIEVLGADGRSEYFTGWNDLDEMNGPDFSSDRDYATKYDLTHHRDEVLADYEKLCEMGFDASIETFSRGSQREDSTVYADIFKPRPGLLGLIVRGANLQAAE